MFFSEYQYKSTAFLDNAYDEEVCLLYLKRTPVSDLYFMWNEEYTHQLLASTEYAVRLLEENNPERIKRVEDILSVCVKLQYTSINRESFGLFPYHSEIYNTGLNLSEKNNTVSFKIGVNFLLILKKHTDKLNPYIVERIKNSVYNLMFRLSTFDKITHHGTFIHLVQTYLFFIAGEYFNNTDFFNSGVSNFLNFYSNIIYNKNYHEYNSFYELSIMSEILSTLKKMLINNDLLNKLDEIYNILWKSISENFHSRFHILAGAMSNISRETPHNYFLHFLSCATGIEFHYDKLPYTHKILSVCPEKYLHNFYDKNQQKFNIAVVSKGNSAFSYMISRIASCYMHPDFALGSINHENLFFANSPFLGYFCSDDPEKPYSFNIRVLNNQKSVFLALFHSVQYNNSVLGAITFSTNHSDFHPAITTNKPGTIILNDFKIRFSITGDIKSLDVSEYDREITVRFKDIFIHYKIPYTSIESLPVSFELSRDENHLYYDVVIGKGIHTKLDFSKLKEAICQFLFTIKKDSESLNACNCYTSEKNLTAEFDTGEYVLKTVTPYRPDSFEFTSCNDMQFIDNLTLQQYVDFTDSKARQYKTISESIPEIKFLSPDNNSFASEFSELEKVSVNLISSKVEHLLNILNRQNFSVDVFKHYAIHIITTVFDKIKHENVQFEQIINNNYSDIYRHISYLPDKKRIIEIILSITAELQKNCLELQSQPKNKSLVTDIIKILESNYSDTSLSLTSLSEMTGFSEPYISKQFKAVTGMNYMKYISKLRVEKAKAFLSDGVSPEETCVQCGFTNMHTFNRVFKEHTGVTSGKWKNKL